MFFVCLKRVQRCFSCSGFCLKAFCRVCEVGVGFLKGFVRRFFGRLFQVRCLFPIFQGFCGIIGCGSKPKIPLGSPCADWMFARMVFDPDPFVC